MRILLGLISLIPLAPSHLGSGDSVQPRDTVSVVRTISPQLPSGVLVSIVGGDALFRLESDGHDIAIPGYQDEPYIKIQKNNEVFINDGSQTTFLNDDRYAAVDLSDFTQTVEPQWRKIATNGIAMWHDHRVHWMSLKKPAAINKEGTVLEWSVPFVVDSQKITVSGTLFLREQASVLWWLSGILAMIVAVFLSVSRRREMSLIFLGVSLAGVVIGMLQYFGLPDGARVTPLLLMFSGGATVFSGAGLFTGRNIHKPQHVSLSLFAGAGAALVVCAWLCLGQVRAAYVPGVEPMWLVRAMIPVALGIGLVAVIDGVTRIVRTTV